MRIRTAGRNHVLCILVSLRYGRGVVVVAATKMFQRMPITLSRECDDCSAEK